MEGDLESGPSGIDPVLSIEHQNSAGGPHFRIKHNAYQLYSFYIWVPHNIKLHEWTLFQILYDVLVVLLNSV